jgi:hypothetical protein
MPRWPYDPDDPRGREPPEWWGFRDTRLGLFVIRKIRFVRKMLLGLVKSLHARIEELGTGMAAGTREIHRARRKALVIEPALDDIVTVFDWIVNTQDVSYEDMTELEETIENVIRCPGRPVNILDALPPFTPPWGHSSSGPPMDRNTWDAWVRAYAQLMK